MDTYHNYLITDFWGKKGLFSIKLNWYCIRESPQNHFKASDWDEQHTVQCWIMSTSIRLLWVAAILPWFCSKLQQITKISEKVSKNFQRLMISAIVIFSVEICIAATCIFISFLISKINTLAFLAAACSKSYFMQLRN